MLPSAERTPAALAGRLALALDGGRGRFGLVALDEGAEPDERVPAALGDRLALHLDLEGLAAGDLDLAAERPVAEVLIAGASIAEASIAGARARLGDVVTDDGAAAALTEAATMLGIDSLRAPLLALRAARVLAALAGRARAVEEDVAQAARLVLGPRATRFPAAPESDVPAEAPAPEDGREAGEAQERRQGTLEDRVLDAVKAALPETLFAAGGVRRRGAGEAGSGARSLARRGRPAPSRRGRPEGGRLDLIATLRAAAPWQPLRTAPAQRPQAGAAAHGAAGRAEPQIAGRDADPGAGPAPRRVVVLPEDFRIRRFVRPAESVLIFVVDASGSAAAARLAEAKGAVELMLGRAYARREKVALIAFRGAAAELLLPPTRSLVQARRRLAVLPGGGGTPLAAGLAAAAALAAQIRRRGATPYLALLTDGRGNVALDGTPGRAQAAEDAAALARRLAADGVGAVVIDTANRPQAAAAALAARDGGALSAAAARRRGGDGPDDRRGRWPGPPPERPRDGAPRLAARGARLAQSRGQPLCPDRRDGLALSAHV